MRANEYKLFSGIEKCFAFVELEVKVMPGLLSWIGHRVSRITRINWLSGAVNTKSTCSFPIIGIIFQIVPTTEHHKITNYDSSNQLSSVFSSVVRLEGNIKQKFNLVLCNQFHLPGKIGA